MGFIGKLIKAIRKSKGYSQARLASGICSSKYVYLIEKEMRTPSSEMLVSFSEKLNYNLYDCFLYMDCDDPLAVKSVIEELDRFRAKKDIDGLDERTEYARGFVDFQKLPWEYRLDHNVAWVELHRNGPSPKVLDLIQKGIWNTGGSMEPQQNNSQTVSFELLDFYNLLWIYYYMSPNPRAGVRYISYVYKILDERKEIKRYGELFIRVASNYLNALYMENQYESVIDTAKTLLDFMKRVNSHERGYRAYFMIARVNYILGNQETALNSLKKALVYCQLFDMTNDLKKLMEYDFVQDFHRSNELRYDLTEAVWV